MLGVDEGSLTAALLAIAKHPVHFNPPPDSKEPLATIRAIGNVVERFQPFEHAHAPLIAAAKALQALGDAYSDAEPIRVFYQVSSRPLYTVGHAHYASELISLCGGQNVFSDLEELAPAIDVEAVIDRNPEIMLAGDDAGDDAFSEWQRWPAIAANRYGNRFLLPADELSRPTTRVLAAARAICEALRSGRANRAEDAATQDT